HPAGIHADLAQTRRMQPAATPLGLVGAQPDQHAADPYRQHRREACSTAGIRCIRCKHLMQTTARQPPAELPIDRLMPERRQHSRFGWPMTLDPGYPAPQRGKLLHRLAHVQCSYFVLYSGQGRWSQDNDYVRADKAAPFERRKAMAGLFALLLATTTPAPDICRQGDALIRWQGFDVRRLSSDAGDGRTDLAFCRDGKP